eukprot:TRINITY_DN2952_c0_g1_i2.p1 TRINITY_DN2952_c0_g1~~TRINITY_DN2952_c0_g1_i2.p1  ORF type:complete len:504 (-),score=144.82 TRINITY_DN2952_c0_g1_i2:5-1516(-)
MATICNMGAEVGATSSIFPFTKNVREYLNETGRVDIAKLAQQFKHNLVADEGCQYHKVIEIDLDNLSPSLNGPYTPDKSTPIHLMGQEAKSKGWPDNISACLIGSCTNSSYEDMTRAASIAKQALDKGLKAKTEFIVTPGSEQIRATMERDGLIKVFTDIGASVLANACGPCIGMWDRTGSMGKNEVNSIVNSFNRNFKARNDGNPSTFAFMGSPEIVTALALSGSLSFNPITDTLIGKDGKEFKLQPPQGQMFPSSGFIKGEDYYQPPSSNPSSVSIIVPPGSKKLQLLEPFLPWDGKDMINMPVLIKCQGKCTTDHISAAGPWLKFRGHVDNLSNNLYIGAVNAENGQVNSVKNQITGQYDSPPTVARYYKNNNIKWCVIGESNFGEGSARESAALSPRYLGGGAVIVKSFARIHETNLKKQGVLALTFSNESDYDLITPSSRVSLLNLQSFAPGKPVEAEIENVADGKKVKILLNHSYNEHQIEWFKAGSALNKIISHSQ